jgi:hypothetical protein
MEQLPGVTKREKDYFFAASPGLLLPDGPVFRPPDQYDRCVASNLGWRKRDHDRIYKQD